MDSDALAAPPNDGKGGVLGIPAAMPISSGEVPER